MTRLLDTAPCILCGATACAEIFVVEARHVIRCLGCGLTWLKELPSLQELDRLYNDPSYFELQYFAVDDERNDTSHFRQQQRAVLAARDLCTTQYPLLDVGPGKGALLNMCRRRAIPAEGLEFSGLAAQRLSRDTGLTVHHGGLEALAIQGRRYGMITAFDVIEHCPDPLAWLQNVSSLLDTGGLLHLSTINIDNALDRVGRALSRFGYPQPLQRLYPAFHLYYFTPLTLVGLLDKAGFTVVDLKQENYSPEKASPSLAVRLVLRGLYLWHDLSGKKTNLYVACLRR